MKKISLIVAAIAILLAACSGPSSPTEQTADVETSIVMVETAVPGEVIDNTGIVTREEFDGLKKDIADLKEQLERVNTALALPEEEKTSTCALAPEYLVPVDLDRSAEVARPSFSIPEYQYSIRIYPNSALAHLLTDKKLQYPENTSPENQPTVTYYFVVQGAHVIHMTRYSQEIVNTVNPNKAGAMILPVRTLEWSAYDLEVAPRWASLFVYSDVNNTPEVLKWIESCGSAPEDIQIFDVLDYPPTVYNKIFDKGYLIKELDE